MLSVCFQLISVPPESVYLSRDDVQIVTDEIQVVDGTFVTITCTADNAKPAATIEWYLEGDNITDVGKQEIHSHEDSVLLDTTSDLELTFTSAYCNKELHCVVKHSQTNAELTTAITFDVLGRYIYGLK